MTEMDIQGFEAYCDNFLECRGRGYMNKYAMGIACLTLALLLIVMNTEMTKRQKEVLTVSTKAKPGACSLSDALQ